MATYIEGVLLPSAARTASANGEASEGFGQTSQLFVHSTVTARSGTNPTLDVKIQHSIDGGATWHDLITLAQQTNTGTVTGTTSAFYGDTLRAVATIGGTTPSFTFSVHVAGIERPATVIGPTGPTGPAGA